jgi:hypothetical protein
MHRLPSLKGLNLFNTTMSIDRSVSATFFAMPGPTIFDFLRFPNRGASVSAPRKSIVTIARRGSAARARRSISTRCSGNPGRSRARRGHPARTGIHYPARWRGKTGLRECRRQAVAGGPRGAVCPAQSHLSRRCSLSRQPLCEEVLALNGHFIFVCKPSSHPLIQEYITGVDLIYACAFTSSRPRWPNAGKHGGCNVAEAIRATCRASRAKSRGQANQRLKRRARAGVLRQCRVDIEHPWSRRVAEARDG